MIAAHEASKVVLSIYAKEQIKTEKKEDNSPVTEADLASNQVIKKILTKETGLSVLSEEMQDDASRLQEDLLWLVDPLDGTKEFLAKNGEFSINLALIERGQPVVGVVICPAKQSTYFAALGEGAYLLKDEQSQQLKLNPKTSIENISIAVSRSHLKPELKAKFDSLPGVRLVQRGSALKYCEIAENSIQASVRKTPLYEWDIAAADCILREAGGMMTDLSGEAFTYNNHDLLIDRGVVVAEKSLHGELLELIK